MGVKKLLAFIDAHRDAATATTVVPDGSTILVDGYGLWITLASAAERAWDSAAAARADSAGAPTTPPPTDDGLPWWARSDAFGSVSRHHDADTVGGDSFVAAAAMWRLLETLCVQHRCRVVFAIDAPRGAVHGAMAGPRDSVWDHRGKERQKDTEQLYRLLCHTAHSRPGNMPLPHLLFSTIHGVLSAFDAKYPGMASVRAVEAEVDDAVGRLVQELGASVVLTSDTDLVVTAGSAHVSLLQHMSWRPLLRLDESFAPVSKPLTQKGTAYISGVTAVLRLTTTSPALLAAALGLSNDAPAIVTALLSSAAEHNASAAVLKMLTVPEGGDASLLLLGLAASLTGNDLTTKHSGAVLFNGDIAAVANALRAAAGLPMAAGNHHHHVETARLAATVAHDLTVESVASYAAARSTAPPATARGVALLRNSTGSDAAMTDAQQRFALRYTEGRGPLWHLPLLLWGVVFDGLPALTARCGSTARDPSALPTMRRLTQLSATLLAPLRPTSLPPQEGHRSPAAAAVTPLSLPGGVSWASLPSLPEAEQRRILSAAFTLAPITADARGGAAGDLSLLELALWAAYPGLHNDEVWLVAAMAHILAASPATVAGIVSQLCSGILLEDRPMGRLAEIGHLIRSAANAAADAVSLFPTPLPVVPGATKDAVPSLPYSATLLQCLAAQGLGTNLSQLPWALQLPLAIREGIAATVAAVTARVALSRGSADDDGAAAPTFLYGPSPLGCGTRLTSPWIGVLHRDELADMLDPGHTTVAAGGHAIPSKAGAAKPTARAGAVCDSSDSADSDAAPELMDTDDDEVVGAVFGMLPSLTTRAPKFGTAAVRETERPLPIVEHMAGILDAIDRHSVVCIQGETGCGKSSMIPLYLLLRAEQHAAAAAANSRSHRPPRSNVSIVVTQPRRIAATTLAQRVASLLGEQVGERVGYRVGGGKDFHKESAKTQIRFVTTGYLLENFVSDSRLWREATHIVLDEVHERSLQADMLSLVLKLRVRDWLASRADLSEHTDVTHRAHFAAGVRAATMRRLVVMSATIQADMFRAYFADLALGPAVAVAAPPDSPQLLRPMVTDGNRAAVASAAVAMDRTLEAIPSLFVGARRCKVTEFFLDEFIAQPSHGVADDDDDDDGDLVVADPEAAGLRSSMLKSLPRDVQASLSGYVKKLKNARGRTAKLADPDIRAVADMALACVAAGTCILVFLPGLDEIQRVFEGISTVTAKAKTRAPCTVRVHALHSIVDIDEQRRIVTETAHDECKVVLATNIAETSVTIPDVKIVLDAGLARRMGYDHAKKMRMMTCGWCSQSAAKQRAGRAGRVSDGVVIRLYTRDIHERLMPEFDDAEMMPLEYSVLQVRNSLAAYGDAAEVMAQLVEPPPADAVQDALAQLVAWGALGPAPDYVLQEVGTIALTMPCDVSMTRAILTAASLGCAAEMVVVAAGLTTQRPLLQRPLRTFYDDDLTFTQTLAEVARTTHHFDRGLHSDVHAYLAAYEEMAHLHQFRVSDLARHSDPGVVLRIAPRQVNIFLKYVQQIAQGITRSSASIGFERHDMARLELMRGSSGRPDAAIHHQKDGDKKDSEPAAKVKDAKKAPMHFPALRDGSAAAVLFNVALAATAELFFVGSVPSGQSSSSAVAGIAAATPDGGAAFAQRPTGPDTVFFQGAPIDAFDPTNGELAATFARMLSVTAAGTSSGAADQRPVVSVARDHQRSVLAVRFRSKTTDPAVAPAAAAPANPNVVSIKKGGSSAAAAAALPPAAVAAAPTATAEETATAAVLKEPLGAPMLWALPHRLVEKARVVHPAVFALTMIPRLHPTFATALPLHGQGTEGVKFPVAVVDRKLKKVQAYFPDAKKFSAVGFDRWSILNAPVAVPSCESVVGFAFDVMNVGSLKASNCFIASPTASPALPLLAVLSSRPVQSLMAERGQLVFIAQPPPVTPTAPFASHLIASLSAPVPVPHVTAHSHCLVEATLLMALASLSRHPSAEHVAKAHLLRHLTACISDPANEVTDVHRYGGGAAPSGKSAVFATTMLIHPVRLWTVQGSSLPPFHAPDLAAFRAYPLPPSKATALELLRKLLVPVAPPEPESDSSDDEEEEEKEEDEDDEVSPRQAKRMAQRERESTKREKDAQIQRQRDRKEMSKFFVDADAASKDEAKKEALKEAKKIKKEAKAEAKKLKKAKKKEKRKAGKEKQKEKQKEKAPPPALPPTQPEPTSDEDAPPKAVAAAPLPSTKAAIKALYGKHTDALKPKSEADVRAVLHTVTHLVHDSKEARQHLQRQHQQALKTFKAAKGPSKTQLKKLAAAAALAAPPSE